ncbi:hypothetical protein SLEP1_g60063 [Rubroshorea leprosula]|nr:hypothetical protein SLEP1_g60063 [Rubroshorea leprosula]
MLHELLLVDTLGLHRRSHNRRQGSPEIPRHTVISDECTVKLASDISFIEPTER